MTKDEFDDLQERFDGRYVLRDNCDEYRDGTARKFSNDDKRLAVIEHDLKSMTKLLWVAATSAVGIVAERIVSFFIGG